MAASTTLPFVTVTPSCLNILPRALKRAPHIPVRGSARTYLHLHHGLARGDFRRCLPTLHLRVSGVLYAVVRPCLTAPALAACSAPGQSRPNSPQRRSLRSLSETSHHKVAPTELGPWPRQPVTSRWRSAFTRVQISVYVAKANIAGSSDCHHLARCSNSVGAIAAVAATVDCGSSAPENACARSSGAGLAADELCNATLPPTGLLGSGGSYQSVGATQVGVKA